MSTEALHPPELLEALHMDLQHLLQINPVNQEYKEEIELPSPWQVVDEVDPFKAKVIHTQHGLFAKSYAPRTAGYADSYFAALQELSQFPFEIPILNSIGKSNGTIFFRQGKHIENYPWNALSEDEKMNMTEIVKKHGLSPLARYSKLVIIEIEGREYMSDPIEDSIASIDDFLHSENM